MIKRFFILLLFFLRAAFLFGQEQSSYQKYFDKAQEYIQKREYTKAIEEFEKVLVSENPHELAAAYFFIGESYFYKREYVKAIENYERAIAFFIKTVGEIHQYTALSYNNIGFIYFCMGEFDRAIGYYNKSLSIKIKLLGELHFDNVAIYNNLGAVYTSKGEYAKAIGYYEKALEIRLKVLGELHTDTATSYNNIGATYHSNGEYDKAIVFFNKALSILLVLLGDIHPDIASSYNNIGAVYASKGEYDKALLYHEKALAIRLKILGELHPDTALSYNNIGFTYASKGEYDRAIVYYNKALTILLNVFGEINPEIALSNNNLGGAYQAKGEYEKAISYYEKALAIRLKVLGELHPDTAMSYNNIGLAYTSKGEYDKALMYHEKALAIRLKVFGEHHKDIALSYNNIGFTYASKGEYDRAIAYYDKALTILLMVLGEFHPDIATSYNNMGTAYHAMGEYDKALVYHEKALAIRLKILGELHPDTATSYNNIGAAYHAKGEYDKSLFYHEKALAIRLKLLGGHHPDTATSYNNVGLAYASKGEFDKAIGYYERALSILFEVRGELNPEIATSYNNIGAAYHANGDYDRAIIFYHKSLEIRIKVLGEIHPDIAQSYNNIGFAYYSKGENDRAIYYYEKALLVLNRMNSRQEIIVSAGNLGILYLQLQNYPKAKVCFDEAISIIEQARAETGSGRAEFMARNIECYLYSLKTSVLMKDAKGVFATSEAMRARGFLDRLSLSAALSVPGISEADRQKMIGLSDELESLVHQREQELKKPVIEQNRDRLVRLADSILSKEGEFQALDESLMKNERYRALRKPGIADLAAAQRLCGDKDAILEYVIWEGTDKEKQSWCIVITKKGATVVELDRNFNYSAAVAGFRAAVMASAYDSEYTDASAALLYAKLIAPVEKLLAGVTRLVIVPDGALAFLPFDALRKDNKSPYLCETFTVSLSPSVSVSLMVAGRNYSSSRLEMIAFGGAVYSASSGGMDRGNLRGREEKQLSEKEKLARARETAARGLGDYYEALGYEWENLPGTLVEVNRITGEVFGNKGVLLITGKDATEEKVKSLSKKGELEKYKVIHFACHGYYDQDYPSFSSIIFSEASRSMQSREDGYLNVEETALLVLQADLVSLSACETGLGKITQGDGVIGLTRALLVAGANRVAVTLWNVADEATSAFMIRVYTKVVKEKKSYEDAIRETKLEFIRSKDYASPYYWSPFVIYSK